MMRDWLQNRGSAKMVTRLGGRDYLWRVYLLALRHGPIERVMWHTFYRDDPDPLHNHPWDWGRIIVRGWYREHSPDSYVDCGPGHIVWRRPATSFHRVELITPTVSTIFWHGPRYNTWGFNHPDGFRPAPDQGQDGRPLVGTILPRKLGPPPEEIPQDAP